MTLGEMNEPLSDCFIVIEEWNYPCERGRNVCEDWDTTEEALSQAKELAEAEESNFDHNCKVDRLPTEKYEKSNGEVGFIISSKNGLDPFYYVARVVRINKFQDEND